MKNHSIILICVIFCFSTLFYFFVIPNKKKSESDAKYYEYALKNYSVFSAYIPDTLYFAEERVPLEKYYVRERLERELTSIMYLHARTILTLKRTQRFFPLFDSILQKNNIPKDFRYLALTESELTQAVSPSGARGIWQFMKNTAIEYGLEVTNDIDERYHIEKSTKAACKYLQTAYQKFSNWTMAAAAYNMGASRLPNMLETQQVDSYYDLIMLEETNRYVYRILAYKLIYENPRQYGFILRNKDLYYPIPTTKIIVDTTIDDLSHFAAENKCNLLLLKEHNPWLRTNQLPNVKGKKYEILLPKTIWYKDMPINEPIERLLNDTLSF